MSVNAADLVVRKSLHVAAPVEQAWEVFTERIGDWWPLGSHSLLGERAETAHIEGRSGGRMYERAADGEEAHWGDVIAWEPPHRLVVAWHVNKERAEPTEWEVRFEPDGEGTRVELEHRGWERYEDGAEAAASYNEGWDVVLDPYAELLGR